VHHFVELILPRIWSERMEVQLWIVGKDPPQSVRQLAKDGRIQVTGTVHDIRPYLRSATLAVAPAPYTVGIQNKVLEALACKTPVVASSQAASGLTARNYQELLVADDPDEFAKAVLTLLAEPGIRRTLGRAGRRYVKQHHSWSNSVTKLEGIYDELIGPAS
ncbi:MAG: glycosyltransferase, partial [Anaerolineales bacterium]